MKKFNLLLVCVMALGGGSFARADDSAAELMEKFVTELLASIRKPRIELDFVFNSESSSPFGIEKLDADIYVPLKDALEIPITKKTPGGQEPPILVVGADNMVAHVSADKKDAQDDLDGEITFMKDSKPARLPIQIRVKLFDPISFALERIRFSAPEVSGSSQEMKLVGSCDLMQEMVDLKSVMSGSSNPAVSWKEVSKCEYGLKFNPSTNKYEFQFAFSNKSQ